MDTTELAQVCECSHARRDHADDSVEDAGMHYGDCEHCACQFFVPATSRSTGELLGDLLDRSCEAHDLAAAVDDHENSDLAATALAEITGAWGDTLGLDEDDAWRLGVAVFAAYVVAEENAVDTARHEYADMERGPCMSWGSSPWSAEAFPKAALGL